MSRQIRAKSTTNGVASGSASAVGQNSAISWYVVLPSRNAAIRRRTSFTCSWNSWSTRCQSICRCGPSMKPSSEIDMKATTAPTGSAFRHEDAEGVARRVGVHAQRLLLVVGAVEDQLAAQGEDVLVLGLELLLGRHGD